MNPGVVTASSTKDVDVSIPGAKTDSRFFVAGPVTLEAGLVGVCLGAVSAGVVRFRFANVTTANVTGVARDWTYVMSGPTHALPT